MWHDMTWNHMAWHNTTWHTIRWNDMVWFNKLASVFDVSVLLLIMNFVTPLPNTKGTVELWILQLYVKMLIIFRLFFSTFFLSSVPSRKFVSNRTNGQKYILQCFIWRHDWSLQLFTTYVVTKLNLKKISLLLLFCFTSVVISLPYREDQFPILFIIYAKI